jgi:ring-1,2-phenylacetyl-CoA epoxidase subunit PaaE
MHPTLKDWQIKNKTLLQSPRVAWPTVILFLLGLVIFIASITASLNHAIPVWSAMLINTIVQFVMFTIFHDASHRSLSQINRLNECIGAIAIFILTPIASFKVFRYIHMQHHRFTNESLETDPDFWGSQGSKYLLPFRWMLLDLHYLRWYLQRWKSRPRREQVEFISTLSVSLAVIIGASFAGYAIWVLLLWIIPGRLASTVLVMAFDYLPHYPHDTTAKENEYRATHIKPTMSTLMTPLLLCQNYHLIHHLYPRVPFYIYPWIWSKAKDPLISSGARLMLWSGEEIDPLRLKDSTTSDDSIEPTS